MTLPVGSTRREGPAVMPGTLPSLGAAGSAAPALELTDLRVWVSIDGQQRHLVDGVSLSVPRSSVLGVVGETGAGKTMTMRSLLGLLPPGVRCSGQLRLAGRAPRSVADHERMRELRGTGIGIILQNPVGMFDPLRRMRSQLLEAVVRRRSLSERDAEARAHQLLLELGFTDPDAALQLYPHQVSGGMGQRLAIAMTLMPRPAVIVADEPTSALDANLRVDTLRLLRRMGAEEDAAVVIVSHDLGLVSNFCDSIAVMYAGRIVETGPTARVLGHPEHPYTRALAACSTSVDAAPRQPLPVIPGTAPAPQDWPDGCLFAPRCPLAFDRCVAERPQLRWVADDAAACHLAFGHPT
jgi:oligopeptide/dipeptide ABC transporter ATP-binding protein